MPNEMPNGWQPRTIAAQALGLVEPTTKAVVPPLHLATTFVRDPDNHRIELFTSDYLTVDTDHEPIRWTLDDPQRQTLWGQPAPKSWFEEGSPFAGVPVREPVLATRPVVAR